MDNIPLNKSLKKYLDEKFDKMNKKFNSLEENVNSINTKYYNEKRNKVLKINIDRNAPNGRI